MSVINGNKNFVYVLCICLSSYIVIVVVDDGLAMGKEQSKTMLLMYIVHLQYSSFSTMSTKCFVVFWFFFTKKVSWLE